MRSHILKLSAICAVALVTWALWHHADATPLEPHVAVDREWVTPLPEAETVTRKPVRPGKRKHANRSSVDVPTASAKTRTHVEPNLATTLRVIAADTGANLNNVTVVTDVGFTTSSKDPGTVRTNSMTNKGHSPISLPAPENSKIHRREYRVVAPGYAWQKVTVNMVAGTEVLVHLQPGGSLDSWIVGDELPRRGMLRLYPIEGPSPYVELAPKLNQSQRLEGILPGAYRLRLELGAWYQHPMVIAEAEVTIEAGHESRVELTAQAIQPPAKTSASIILRVPSSWRGDEQLALRVQPRGTVARWENAWKSISHRELRPTKHPGEFRASIKALHVGRYMVIVSPSQYRAIIEPQQGAINEFVIEVPEAGEVEVLVIDDHTNQAVPNGTLAWAGPKPPGVNTPGYQSIQFIAGVASFQAPVGALKLGISVDGYASIWDEQQTVWPGLNEFTLRLKRACGIRIALLDGEAIVPMPGVSTFELTSEGHDGRLTTTSSEGWARVNKPGRYRLTIDPINGYQAIPARVIDIGAATMVDVEIVLTRK